MLWNVFRFFLIKIENQIEKRQSESHEGSVLELQRDLCESHQRTYGYIRMKLRLEE